MINRVRVFAGPSGLPERLHLAVADLPDLSGALPWQGDRQSFGSSWSGPDEAVLAAVGEAAERYCAPHPRPAHERLHGSHRSLSDRGVRALDPDRLALYSPAQYASPGFRFRPFTADDEVWWIRGRSLSRAEEVYVPAFLVYATWPQMPEGRAEPRYLFPPTGGLAAGPSDEHAQLSGLEEVVERDAVAVWWANAQRLPALPVPADIEALLRPAGRDYAVRLIPIDNVFGAPVVAAVVRDEAEGWLTLGAATRHDLRAAALKALAEAYLLQLTCRALDDPRSGVAPSDAQGGSHPPGSARRSPLKPWRENRSYLDAYRADAGDVVEMLCQQQLHLDRRAGERVADWTWDLPVRAWADLPAPAERSLDSLRDRVESAGHEVLWVDLTTPEATRAGMRVGRVVVPGTVCTAPAAYPPWGGERVQRSAVQLGWRQEPLAEHLLNTFPMPHT